MSILPDTLKKSPLLSSKWYEPDDIDNEVLPIDGPLYTPTVPSWDNDKFEPLQFQDISMEHTYTQPAKCRKRIYGNEFKELTILNIQPKSKLLKLDQPQHQILSSIDKNRQYNMPLPQYASISELNVQNNHSNTSNNKLENIIEHDEIESISTQSQLYTEEQLQQHTQKNILKIPTPTVTKRNYINKRLLYTDIPKLCDNCYGVDCICQYFAQ
ncbi:Fen-1 [Mauternbach virus]|uniref:Fen-1 n=1 Tax=Mauternbach virus TaxID=2486603 RepID=A0A3G3E789_9VIRU|nr:Fen-1 [Mauternbach virus]AYP97961.1 Fen-1 [Mauternbach virus]